MKHVIVSNVAPNTAPQFPGQHYINTVTGQHYLANGIETVANWVLNGSGGGGGGGSGVPAGAIILSDSPTPPAGFEPALSPPQLLFGAVRGSPAGVESVLTKPLTPGKVELRLAKYIAPGSRAGSPGGTDIDLLGDILYVSNHGTFGANGFETSISATNVLTGVETSIPEPYVGTTYGRLSSCMAAVTGYLVAHFDNQANPNLLYVYNLATSTWTTSSAPPSPFADESDGGTPTKVVTMRGFEGVVHVFSAGAASTVQHFTYNPVTDAWVNLTANLPTNLADGSARGSVCIDADAATLYFISRPPGSSTRLFSYSIVGQLWMQLNNIGSNQVLGHENARSLVFDGRVYIGNASNSPEATSIEFYVLADNTSGSIPLPGVNVSGSEVRFEETTLLTAFPLLYSDANGLFYYRAL